MRGSNFRVLTGKILTFWISRSLMGGGCLREVVTQESLTVQSNPALWAPSLQIPR